MIGDSGYIVDVHIEQIQLLGILKTGKLLLLGLYWSLNLKQIVLIRL